MTKSQKILLAVLLIGTIVFWIAIVAFPNMQIRQLLGGFKISDETSSESKKRAQEIRNKYGTLTAAEGEAYMQEVLKSRYQPGNNLSDRYKFFVPPTGDQIKMMSFPWTRGDDTFHISIFKSLKSERYSQENLPLDYEVYVTHKMSGKPSPDESFEIIKQYFNTPGTVDFNTREEFETALDGKAMEVTWKNNDGTLESRSVLDKGEEGIIYLIACRVFQDSEYYQKNTCYVKK